MKIEYTNHHDVPVTTTTADVFGGLMVTVTYSEKRLHPEVPMIRTHSWTGDMGSLHVSTHHIGLMGFDYTPDGNDMITLTGENEFEKYLVAKSRLFCCNNQILMLPESSGA